MVKSEELTSSYKIICKLAFIVILQNEREARGEELPNAVEPDDFIATITVYQSYEQTEGDAAGDLKT